MGCGSAGLFAARMFRHGPSEVTLVDRHNHHLFQPMLYQVATGVLSEGEIAPPTGSVLRPSGSRGSSLAEGRPASTSTAADVTAPRPDGPSS